MSDTPKWVKPEWNMDDATLRHLTKNPMEANGIQIDIRKMVALERIADALEAISKGLASASPATEPRNTLTPPPKMFKPE